MDKQSKEPTTAIIFYLIYSKSNKLFTVIKILEK